MYILYLAMILLANSKDQWSDCADAEADLGIRCPYMYAPEDTFSYGLALLILTFSNVTNTSCGRMNFISLHDETSIMEIPLSYISRLFLY